jgi:hypothetical protein
MKYYIIVEEQGVGRYINTVPEEFTSVAIEVTSATFHKTIAQLEYGKKWILNDAKTDVVLVNVDNIAELIRSRNKGIVLASINKLINDTVIKAQKYDSVEQLFRYSKKPGIYQSEAIVLAEYVTTCETIYDSIDSDAISPPTQIELETILPLNPNGIEFPTFKLLEVEI